MYNLAVGVWFSIFLGWFIGSVGCIKGWLVYVQNI